MKIMSCWTHITGMIELNIIKSFDSKELDEAFSNNIIEILEPKLKELKLEGSEGGPDFVIINKENDSSIFLIYRGNLRSFGEKYKGEKWITDFTELKSGIYKIIEELNNLFEYNKYDMVLTKIYDKINENDELNKELEKDSSERNYERKREKLIKKIIEKEYNNLLPICMNVSNLVFQGINSYSDTINFNLNDITDELITTENNIIVDKRKIKNSY